MILLDCATEYTSKELRTTISKFTSWKKVKPLIYAENDIPAMLKVIVDLPKTATLEATPYYCLILKFLTLSQLWIVFRASRKTVRGK